MARAQRSTFLGLPGSFRWPGWAAIRRNSWDTRSSAPLFPPKAFGYGWSFNFAYPRIKTKPFWARTCALVLGTLMVIVLAWAIVCLVMIIFFLLTEPAAVQTPIIRLG